MQWFRLYQEFATDAKVQMLSEINQRRLVMLFCFRCNSDVTLQDEEVAFQLRITSEEWASTKAEFIKRGFIDKYNNVLNWDKRQYVSDSSNQRVKRHREKVKQECNVTVTPPETEQIQITDTEKKELAPRGKCSKPEDVSETVWNDFKAQRKAQKAAITETALEGIRREAEKAGMGLEPVLREMLARGWRGFKAEWLTKGKENGNHSRKNHTANSSAGTRNKSTDALKAALAGLEG